MQKFRQELPDDIETGGGSKRDAGVSADVFYTLPTWRSPNTGDCTCTHYARYAGNGKGLPAIRMPSCYSAEDCVARPCPETVLMRREISVVFVKNDGGSVGDGLAHAVVRKVAPVALSVCTPTLPPFFGAVLPLANARSRSLPQQLYVVSTAGPVPWWVRVSLVT